MKCLHEEKQTVPRRYEEAGDALIWSHLKPGWVLASRTVKRIHCVQKEKRIKAHCLSAPTLLCRFSMYGVDEAGPWLTHSRYFCSISLYKLFIQSNSYIMNPRLTARLRKRCLVAVLWRLTTRSALTREKEGKWSIIRRKGRGKTRQVLYRCWSLPGAGERKTAGEKGEVEITSRFTKRCFYDILFWSRCVFTSSERRLERIVTASLYRRLLKTTFSRRNVNPGIHSYRKKTSSRTQIQNLTELKLQPNTQQ